MKLQYDKKLHLIACSIITVCVTIINFIMLLLNFPMFIVIGVNIWMVSMGVGIGKEYGDHTNPNNQWDWGDILYDAIGATIMTILMTSLIGWYKNFI